MYYVKKTFEIAGAHRLHLTYDSKCQNLHGHNWKISVFCKSEKLDENGMVLDFSKISNLVKEKFDHKFLNDCFYGVNPTAENFAFYLCKIIPKCYRVEIQESEGNLAIFEKNEN